MVSQSTREAEDPVFGPVDVVAEREVVHTPTLAFAPPGLAHRAGRPRLGIMVPLGRERLHDLRSRLEAIAEELADLGRADSEEALDTEALRPKPKSAGWAALDAPLLKAAALLDNGDEGES